MRREMDAGSLRATDIRHATLDIEAAEYLHNILKCDLIMRPRRPFRTGHVTDHRLPGPFAPVFGHSEAISTTEVW